MDGKSCLLYGFVPVRSFDSFVIPRTHSARCYGGNQFLRQSQFVEAQGVGGEIDKIDIYWEKIFGSIEFTQTEEIKIEFLFTRIL